MYTLWEGLPLLYAVASSCVRVLCVLLSLVTPLSPSPHHPTMQLWSVEDETDVVWSIYEALKGCPR